MRESRFGRLVLNYERPNMTAMHQPHWISSATKQHPDTHREPCYRPLLRVGNAARPIGCISRDRSIANPNVDQGLHWLHVFVRQQTEEFGHRDVVDKARIQIGPAIRVRAIRHVPERVDPVRVVEMGVQAKDLAKAGLHIAKETLWKTGILPNPVTTGESRQRSIQGGRRHSDWSIGIRRIEAPGSIGT